MNSLRKIIWESLELAENLNQADKIYFKTGLLTPEDKEIVLDITHGDAYTRLISDWLYHLTKVWNDHGHRDSTIKMLNQLYDELKGYNKNVFPLKYDLQKYNAQASGRGMHILDLAEMLTSRQRAINVLRKLPSVAIDNLKKIIREPRNHKYDFDKIYEDLSHLKVSLEYIPGPSRYDDEESTKKKEIRRNMMLNKIFASNNSLEQMVAISGQFANAFNVNADESPKEEIIDNLEYIEADLVQNSGDILVIKANDQEAISKLGCTSMWCFSRPGGEQEWQDYAQRGYVYVIYDFSKDFDDALFMMTYLPDSGEIYSSINVPIENLGIENEYNYLSKIGVDVDALHASEDWHNSVKERQKELNEVRNIVRNLLYFSYY